MGRLQKPWGLKILLLGRWTDYAGEKMMSRTEVRLKATLELINFLEFNGVPPESILEQLLRMRA